MLYYAQVYFNVYAALTIWFKKMMEYLKQLLASKLVRAIY